ncbi:amino acid adenylation domain-containing protein [Bacillus cereus BAG5X1-1]|uniref:Amino acid adenylation domain-containing protein n=1 Tax=Bacillus cereus BAG5X1-1 TaxID=1053189 RepID=J7ZMQ2_BACCE|nr:non-ribosomal peptide synthetase [Bacillus cereus]EJQ37641.1 amino acid adenylation domain-containing protein [Bacillus cereus BAG5X1-1]
MKVTKVEKIYPLSNMQKGMLFHAIEDKNSDAYFEQIVLDIKGNINETIFEESFNEIMKRHEILRASFNYKLEEPLHVIMRDRKIKFNYDDISKLKPDNKDKYIKKYIVDDKEKGFDLTKETLMRICLMKTSNESYKVIWTFHHILLDGWCTGIILDELFTIYSCRIKGEEHQLEEPRPYSDYINWLNNQDNEEGMEFWRKYLEGFEQKAIIPKFNSSISREYRRGEKVVEFSKKLTDQVVQMAKRNNVTLNTVVQGIWGLILAKYNNSEDVVFGTVVSGRDATVEGIEKMVGLFINTIPTRIRCESDKTFKEVLTTSQGNAIESNTYNYINLAEVQTLSKLKNNLIDHVLVFENYAFDKEGIEEKENDLGFEVVAITDEERTNYSFSIIVGLGEKLKLTLVYDKNVYDEELIKNIESHIKNVTEQVVRNVDKKLSEIDLISEEEKNNLLYSYNDTKTDYPKEKTIHQLFEEQVEKTPNRVAVKFGDNKLTYRELNGKSNQIARLLRDKGIKPNTIVGIMAERSLEMIIGIMGILKSGAAYLPIDVKAPEDRIGYMLQDSNAKILLTQDKFIDQCNFGVETVNLDQEDVFMQSTDNVELINRSNDTAYVIYTSGSTGTPKGVIIQHYSAIRVVKNTNYIEFKGSDTVLQLSNYSFDTSIFDIFGALLNGAKLVMVEKDTAFDLSKLARLIKTEKISVMFITPALFNPLVDFEVDCLKNLRKVVVGGEKLSSPHVQKALEEIGEDKIINGYGPTESAVFATYYSIKEVANNIPIGKPLSNTSVFIVDRDCKLLPFGVPGELCISGDGLSKGYLNRPELTAEKFISNPYIQGERMYRTGDLARILPDGNIEFLGRIDHQVKIRGYRIELGEIENQLLKHDEVKEAVVIAREDMNHSPYLCAYFTSDIADGESLIQEIREILTRGLPEYMIPAFFVQLEKIPLTTNGKIDRKALPEPDGSGIDGVAYEAPRNEVEEKLVSIWQDILGVEKIGINHHFFEIGGHSLKATTMASRIHKELMVEMPLRQIFQTPTIRGIGEFINSTKESVYDSIKIVEEKDYYPLSSAQRRLYILNKIEGSGVSYNMPFAMKIKGDLDVQQFKKVFRRLIERHEALRTSFVMVDGEPVQKIEKEFDFQVTYREVGTDKVDDIINGFVKPFDLEKAPLLRVEIIKVAEEEHMMVMDMHHIISDGISMSILTRELSRLYEGKELSPLSIQYKDYSAWQKELSTKEEMKKQEKYWMEVFKEEVPVLNMPTDYKRPATLNTEGDLVQFELDGDLSAKLKKVAKEQGVTLYMLLLAGYTTLLSKYTGQEDIVVGSPIAGRPHHDLKNIVGMFVNTLAMRNYPRGDISFRDYLKEVKENALRAYENQDYPFDELVERLDLKRDLSRNALFDTMLVLQNLDSFNEGIEGLKFESYDNEINVAKFDLTLSAIETDNILKFGLEYCTKLFKKETVERISEHFVNVLKTIAHNSEIILDQIEILSEEEKNTLLVDFNETEKDYPKDKTIYQLFEEQADRTPNKVAVVFEDQKLTYRELNEKSNQVARILREKGAQSETIVGIIVERSLEMIVGIMGILKAGAAYLPIDPEFPEERIKYMLEDSNTKLVLTQTHLFKKLDFADKDYLSKIAMNDKTINDQKHTNLEVANNKNDLAYVIYTSGSTGLPKGVLVEHHSLVNLCHWYVDFHKIKETDNITNFLNIIFDASISEIFPCLIAGATLHVLNTENRLDVNKLHEYIESNEVTVTSMPPKMLEQFMLKENKSLRMIVSGGDNVKANMDTSYQIVNAYGPTENTVTTTSFFVDKKGHSIPIGKPMYNTKIYILNKQNQICPIGVAGELCISGAGLARGYLNNLTLTEEKFVENPFVSGERMYRTGDLASWMPDGNIEFIGRIDHQVKIRGYRIELGEIENQLLNHKDIKGAMVIAREDQNNHPYLCGYIISEKALPSNKIKEFLEKKLPEYMIPAYFVQLDKFPLTSNDKVDKKALPEPDRSGQLEVEYEAPRNKIEEKLIEIWGDILGIEDIGINHHFFVSGGDSIKALQIVSRLSRIDLKLEVKDLFANPKIKDLSKYVKKQEKRIKTYEIVEGEVELTPIQKWYFDNNKEELDYFNQSFVLFREDGFDEKIVEKVFNKILEHHDALRMIYEQKDGNVIQYNRGYRENLFNLYDYDIRDLDDKEERIFELATNIQKKSSIKDGKLVNICIFKSNEGDHLLIVIHHLVVDGVSWRIILEDFETLYVQELKGQKLDIGYKTDSFKEFSSKLKKYANSKKLLKERDYWQDIAKAEPKFLPKKQELITDKFENSKTISISLDKEKTMNLLRKSNRAYNTEINDILLTALLIGTRELTGENSIKINMEGHGREEILEDIDISRTVGWFTTMYPVLIDLGEENDIATNIKMVKEIIRKIPNKGIGFGILKFLAKDNYLLNEQKAPISFNYLGEMDSSVNRNEFSGSNFSEGQSIGEKISRNNSIEINSIVTNNTLFINTTFNELEYDEKTIKKLNQKFIESLELIIDHCVGKTEIEKTPYDYGDTKLTLHELELIKEKHGDYKIQKIYPLANMQKGMLFHALENKNSNAYFEQTVLDITGNVDVAVLKDSINKVIQRYEILRASFESEIVEEPRQIILEDRKIDFQYCDIREKCAVEKDMFIKKYKQEDIKKGFNLSTDVLIRFILIRTDENTYKLLWSHHHILLDGWCLGIILGDLFTIYGKLIKNEEFDLEETKPYSDYIKWLEEQDQEEARTYWEHYLNGYEEKTQLPKFNNVSNIDYFKKEKTFEFSKGLTDKIKQLASRNNVTVNTVLQSIWGILLARYNNTDDVLFGTVVSGREAQVEGIETMVGLFINTIPTRIKMEKDKSFEEILKTVQNESIDNNKYNYMSLAEVQAMSSLKKNLIDHIIVFENYAIDKRIDGYEKMDLGFEISDFNAEEQNNYSFSITASLGEKLILDCTYDGNIYDDKIIDNLETHIKTVTEQVVLDENKKVSEIDVLSEEERTNLLFKFNDTKVDYPKEKTIHQLFEEQVERTPENIAVCFEDKKLTYQELNEKSNSLARVLRQEGVTEKDIVAIMVDRSLEMVIGILGILKAGAAYLPIDSEYPNDRISYMLDDSRASILLVENQFTNDIMYNGKVVSLKEHSLYEQEKSNLLNINQPDHLAYIIYTSGTTGAPKGVMVKHKGVINYIYWAKKSYVDDGQFDFPLFTSMAFDLTVTSIYMPLFTGNKIVVYEGIDKTLLTEKIIEENKVDILKVTPTHLRLLENIDVSKSKIKKIVTGGEELKVEQAKKIYNAFNGNVEIYNEYGPTETTVGCMVYKYNVEKDKRNSVSLGLPADNTKLYVLGKNMELLPIGVVGELYIGGECLASGYLNKPELTAEKFVLNPFVPGERMYRTGDLVRILPNGDMEFIGRTDDQVKIRGYRVEIGEIETQLLRHKEIKEAVVIAREDNDSQLYLCAYFTSDVSDGELLIQEIRENLIEELPEYMIPAFFVQLDKMPHTSNKKIDRKALPKPDGDGIVGVAYETPRNEVEVKLVAIWKDILGIDKVGINHNFFEIGGHSLKATTLTSRIHKELMVEVPLRQIFQTPTIKEIGEFINSTKESVYDSIKIVEEKDYYPLSSAQRRLYILNKIEGSGVSYNIPSAMKIKGDLNVNQFENALRKLIERHEALRTSFVMVDGEPVQKIEKEIEFQVTYREVGTDKIGDIVNGFVKPFDLEKAPLLRVEIIKITEDEHIMVMDMHHIISDGVSMGIFTQELTELYKGKTLSPLNIQYKDYSAWQRELSTKEEMKKQEEYWMEVFKEEVPVLNMPTDYKRPATQNTEGDLVYFELDNDLSNKLKNMANEQGVTMYMLLLAGYTTLLSKYTGQEDIVVGSPIAGRPHNDLKQVMGIFVNTLAMRNYPKGDISFRDYLKEVKENALKAYENQDYPFDELVEKLNLKRDMSRSALFDTMLVLQNFDYDEFEMEGLTFMPYPMEANVSKFDLTLTVAEEEHNIQCVLSYSTKLFKKETVARLAKHLSHVFKEITDQPDQSIKDITLLSEEETQTLLYSDNDTKADFQKDRSIPQLFEEQVKKTPYNTAVVFEDQKLTYLELNERANQLARLLQEKGAKPGVTVGMLVEESLDMIIGILAILKAGAAYLPIDPGQLDKRTNIILKDSAASLLIMKGKQKETLEFDGEMIFMGDSSIDEKDRSNLSVEYNSNHNAYIIYTSGSTGTPKGVCIRHRNIVNYMTWFTKEAKLQEMDKAMLVSSYAFDLGYTSLYSALLNGCELHLVTKGVYSNAHKALQYIKEKEISYLKLTPSLFNVMVNDPSFSVNQSCETLRLVVLGGEQINPADVETFYKKYPNHVVMNHYGPTEATIGCVYHIIDSNNLDAFKERPVIGRPIQNMRAYVVDKQMKLVPEGVYGELCVSGEGLAKGYLNRPDLTEEKFVQNPFEPQERMYRTGDLVRRLPDGRIELVGRIDSQVKIRGYRIETEEIKNQLVKHEQIQEAFVIDREGEDGRKHLCAYITSEKDLSFEELRAYMKEEVPEYMIPSYFVQMERIPLTPNGKIDLKALPDPDVNKGVSYVGPRNQVEEQLIKVWEDILGVQKIGITHNFFASGGDSIKALQIISRLSREGIMLEMKDLFTYPEIKFLSNYVKIEKIQEGSYEIETGDVLLTPIQKSYFTGGKEDVNHYNHAVMLYRKDGFHEEMVQEVMEEVLKHHDALRMIYKEEKDEIIQSNREVEKNQFGFYVYDVSKKEKTDEKIQELATTLQKKIDIQDGPLVNVALFKTNDGDHLLLIIHHLVVDGVSWRILFEDLEMGYNQLLKGEKVAFYPKTTSYKEYAFQLNEYAKSKKLEREKKYWVNALQEKVDFLEVNEDVEQFRYEDSHTLSVVMEKEETSRLLRVANRAYQTEINDLLIATLLVATRKVTGENKIRISLEGHGREQIIEGIDISRTVGWFTTKYPVFIDLDNEKELSMTIKTVKEALRKIPNKGIGYGILKHLVEDQDLLNAEQPPILFNYLGQMDEDFNNTVFSSSWMSPGESIGKNHMRENPIDINAVVLDGRLMIDTTYNTKAYKEDVVTEFIEAYKEALRAVINHCVSKERAEKTPFDYGDKELSFQQLDDIKAKYNGFEIEKIYPLANMQQGMLFHALEDKQSSAYFEQIVIECQGSIDVKLFEETLNEIMNRHEILRTSIEYTITEEPRSVILKDRKIGFKYQDIRHQRIDQQKESIEIYIERDREKGFDFSQDSLIRLKLIQTAEEAYTIIWSNHHILFDGWSRGIILGELFHIYENKLAGKNHHLEEPRPYSDYIRWLGEQTEDEGVQYWKHYLEGYQEQAKIPSFKRDSNVNGDRKREKVIEFSNELTMKMNDLANRNHVTLNTVLQSTWGILLATYNQTDDIVFGSVVSGRDAKVDGIEKMVGLFINTVPTRIRVDAKQSFRSILKNVQEQAIESQAYHNITLSSIQSLSELKRDLIDHVMIFENYAIDEHVLQREENGMNLVVDDSKGHAQTNYGLTIIAAPGEQFVLKLIYDENLYPEEFIQNIMSHLTNVIMQVVRNEDQKVKELKILSEEEKHALLVEFNQTKVDYLKDKTVHQLFEEQAKKAPDHIAVVYNEHQLTYQELNERANQLAHTLRKRGVTKEKIVGILVKPSLEMIIGVLGVLKAGGGYLPIDPAYPSDRVQYMLTDSKAGWLLTQEELKVPAGYPGEVILLDQEELYQGDSTNLTHTNQYDDLAYVIYTSGSTGKPKGVLLEHGSFLNMCHWQKDYYQLTEKDRTTKYAGFGFDASVAEIFPCLVAGSTLYIVPEELRLDVEKLNSYFEHNQITMSFLPTQVCEQFLPLANQSLRILLTAGDKLTQANKNPISQYILVNNYGPTENTVVTTAYEIEEQVENIPIGKPISNSQVYIIDQFGKLSPIGVVGELCIGGESLARGYLNQPELTAEKFVENPLKPGTKMYKTGDLAKWLPDGNLVFMGRIDHQVKIRGNRIELGEIESVLGQHPTVKAVVVNVIDGKHLVAYIVPKQFGKNSANQWRQYLSSKLPEYMVPLYFTELNHLPLTPNGKIDKQALPKPDRNIQVGVEYAPPRNDLEEKLVNIWKGILNIEKLSINTNLFEIGANSLNVMTFVSKLYTELNFRIPFKDVFDKPTICSLSKFLENAKEMLKDYTEDCIQLSNSVKGDKKVFCFPPAASIGIAYMGLAKYLDAYSVYSFNFIKSENRIKEYAKIIKSIQPEGPYTLMGYSAGGLLAFDVAKELNKQGCEVEDLILIDSNYRTKAEKLPYTEEDCKKEIYEKFDLKRYKDLERLASDYLVELIMKSYIYALGTITQGTIDGNISYIRAIKEEDTHSLMWENATTKNFRVIQGYGEHLEMISSSHPEVLEKNARVINDILTFEMV